MEKTLKQTDWTQVAEIEIVYKTKVKPSNRPKITGSKDIYSLLLSIWDMNLIELQEQFIVLFLNRANRVLGVYHASTGGLTGTVADPRLILAAALKAGAVAIILSHNHPSSNLTPSRADEQLTQKIKTAACYHDISVLDHIIVTTEGYYSFAEEGLL
jgi:DNA repair protein RadC